MRIIILILMTLFPVIPSWADVTAEIISYKIDQNGNIEVHTQYKIDGVEVVSRYPQENGKYYWVTRYTASAFGNMTEPQIIARIMKEIDDESGALLLESYVKKINQTIATTKLGTLTGSKLTKTQADLKVDNDGDGKADQIWTVTSDGRKLSERAFP